MQALIDGLVRMYAVFSVVPFVPFALVWAIAYMISKNKKVSLLRAMDISTFFLVGAVAVLYNLVFQSSFGLYFLLLLFLLIFGLIGNAQHRKYGQIQLAKIVRAIWRLGFFGLGAAYVLLMAAGLTMNLL